MKNVILASIVAASMSLMANASLASEDNVSKAVDLSDLNLSSEKGMEAARSRVASAAATVCGDTQPYRVAGNLRQAAANNDCLNENVDRIMSQLESSALASR